VHRKDRFDRLQLDHDLVADQKINPIAVVDEEILIPDRNKRLPACRQA
jgi:hypothetical protein